MPLSEDLVEVFNIIHELYPGARDHGVLLAPDELPSLAEGRDALRLFSQIDNPEMRTAVRMLMRLLSKTMSTGDDSTALPESAANTPS